MKENKEENKEENNEEDKEKNFVSSLMRELVTQESNHDISKHERIKIHEAIPTLSRNLMRLHNMKPPDAKKWFTYNYQGKGSFDIQGIVNETLKHGNKKLMERRRKPLNPNKPKIAIILDISYSMLASYIAKAALVLTGILSYVFGGIAESFLLGFIGSFISPKLLVKLTKGENIKIHDHLPLYMDLDYDTLMTNVIFNCEFKDGTEFIPVLDSLEYCHFYDSRKMKFIFVITDGLPEKYTIRESDTAYIDVKKLLEVQNLHYNEAATKKESITLSNYLKQRWDNDKYLIYYWIQLSDRNSLLEFIFIHGYVPPFDELMANSKKEFQDFCSSINKSMNEQAYRDIKALYLRKHSEYYELCEFYWESYKKGDMLFLTLNSLKDGTAINKMMKHFIKKFRKVIKI